MKKDIRTKDGIYTITGNYQLNNINYYTIEERISSISEENIIKQADSIEELCDRFVIVRNGEGADFWKDFDAMKHYSAYINLNDYDAVYGAIWTNKGLIFMAKMNDKGELELI